MWLRTFSGLTAAALVLLLIYLGTPQLMTTVVLCLAALAYIEFDRLVFKTADKVRQLFIVTLIFFSMLSIQRVEANGWVVLTLCFMLLGIRCVIRSERLGAMGVRLEELCCEGLGFAYVVGLLGFLVPIVEGDTHGRHALLLLFLIIFGGDTTAYFVGSRFGRHKLASTVSPKKSIEGSVGAVLMSILLSISWIYFVYKPTGAVETLTLRMVWFAPIISLLGQLGDLFESVLKRSQSQKDSGNFLPGHGGLLDRIDGLCFSAPAFYALMPYILGGI